MLIVIFLFLGTVYGSSVDKHYCSGKDVSIPELRKFKGPLCFAPAGSDNAKKTKVMDKGKSVDQRITIQRGGIVFLTKLSKDHEGTYEATLKTRKWTMTIKIYDCFERHYMDDFTYSVPDKAFSLKKSNNGQPVLKWDRNKHPNEAYVKNNKWTMDSLTQAESGFYYFYDKDNKVLSRVKLTVKEKTGNLKQKANGTVSMNYPWSGGPWNIRFISKDKEKMLMKEGRLDLKDTGFDGRVTFQNKTLQIKSLTTADTGTLDFTDKKGNLAMSVQLKVISESKHIITAAVVCSLVVLVIVGGCCYWKCCKDGDCADTPDESPPAPSNATTVNPPESSFPLLSQSNATNPPQTVPISYLQTNPAYPPPPVTHSYPPGPQTNPAYPPLPVNNLYPPVPQPNNMYPPQPVTNLHPQVAPSPAPCS